MLCVPLRHGFPGGVPRRWYRASGKLTKQLVGPPASVVLETRKLLEEFMDRIPLITALCNPGMQARHWREISNVVGELRSALWSSMPAWAECAYPQAALTPNRNPLVGDQFFVRDQIPPGVVTRAVQHRTTLHRTSPHRTARHCTARHCTAGREVKMDDDFTLSGALHMGLGEHLDAIQEVSENASKEFALEKALRKMESEWAGIEFEFGKWRDTGTYKLRALDDIQMLLDDHLVKTQSMRASPYIGPHEESVKLWEDKLSMTQDIIDQWIKCQDGWLYLEPIFGSEDIMQQASGQRADGTTNVG